MDIIVGFWVLEAPAVPGDLHQLHDDDPRPSFWVSTGKFSGTFQS